MTAILRTDSDSPTNKSKKLAENLATNELSDAEIASVMNPDRLTQLLTQADAFTFELILEMNL